jgi:hypothetical protein
MPIDLKTRNLDDICGQMEKLLFLVETHSEAKRSDNNTIRKLWYVIAFLLVVCCGTLYYLIFS